MKQITTGDNLSLISKAVGGDGKAVQSALGMGMPLVLGSMANTSSKPGGMDILTKMLAQGASNNPMDNLGGFLSNPAAAGGSGMVSTLFGSQMGMIQTTLSQKTGLPPMIVGKVMELATPLVMGMSANCLSSRRWTPKASPPFLGTSPVRRCRHRRKQPVWHSN